MELAEQLEVYPPDVVVFEDCCNYDGGEAGYALADGSVVHENTEEMFTAWEEVSAGAIARSRAAGAQVHWVVTPAIGDRPESEHERLDRYNAIVRGLDVDLIDWRAALTPDGSFQLELEVGGRPTPVRSRDQVHLVAAGNRVVTDVTWDAIADQLGLDGG